MNQRTPRRVKIKSAVFLACYFALAAVMLYLLLQARTPIPKTVWTTFDSSNLLVYFAMTFVLLIIIASSGGAKKKLSLVIFHSILSHMFFVMVFESRYGWDQWVGLGMSQRIFRGDYSPHELAFTIYSPRAILRKIYNIMERVNLFTLSVTLARLISIDVYWTHLLLVPVIWSSFIPILIYRISKFFSSDKTTPFLAALLSCAAPHLIGWGSGTTANSLAWIFFLLGLYLLLRYLVSGRGMLVTIIIAFVAFITHSLVGVISFVAILLAHFYKKAQKTNPERIRTALFLWIFILLIFALPVIFLFRRFTTEPPVGPVFSLKPLEGLSSYDAILLIIFGQYVNMSFADVLVEGIIPLLGLLGLVYVGITGNKKTSERTLSVFSLLLFILLMVDYRIVRVFMVDIPFGTERMWVFTSLLAIPFATILITKTISVLLPKIPKSTKKILPNSFEITSSTFSISSRKALIKMLLFVSISSLVTSAVYKGYPHTYPVVWTTFNELEAARYIEATTQERYIVISHSQIRGAGYAVVGPENPNAYYFGPYSGGELNSYYNELIIEPSLKTVLEILGINNASMVYVIISEVRTPDAEEIVDRLIDLPYFELYQVFSNGVYVIKIEPPFVTPIITGVGPAIYLGNLGKYVNTTYVLNVLTYEALYTVTLTGSPVYNVTWWPAHWSFETIVPDPVSKYIDADTSLSFSGDADEEYNVTWTANILYQPVGWKDDSFKTGWQVSSEFHWLPDQPPVVSTDGDVITLEGSFRKGVREILWLEKDVGNISTDYYRYIIVRWKSTAAVAHVEVVYDDEYIFVLNPKYSYPTGAYSADWKLSTVKLPAGKNITKLSIAIDDYPQWQDVSGVQSAYYDFIMMTNITQPIF